LESVIARHSTSLTSSSGRAAGAVAKAALANDRIAVPKVSVAVRPIMCISLSVKHYKRNPVHISNDISQLLQKGDNGTATRRKD
jgi:hypothetical protein